MFPESFLTMGCSQVFKKVNINDTNFDKLIICQNGLRKPHFVSRLSPSDQFSQNYDTCSKTITWWGGLQHKARYFKWLTGWNNCNYLASLYKLLTIETAHSVVSRHSWYPEMRLSKWCKLKNTVYIKFPNQGDKLVSSTRFNSIYI